MRFPLRPAFSAAVARLRRGLCTAAPLPPFAIIHQARPVGSPELGSTLLLAVPPCTSHLLVPAHLICPRLLHPDAAVRGPRPALGGMVRATSADGLLLLQFLDCSAALANTRAPGAGESVRVASADLDMEPDVTRFVCNPISGELVRLPGVDGTKKFPSWRQPQGLLTGRSVSGHGPPDRYVVAELSVDDEGEGQRFVMRQFRSDTAAWEKLEGLPSPLPLPLRMNMDHEVVAFAGRLYWVDLSWGAVSADPFADRPELRFVELPSGSVWSSVLATDEAATAAQSMHRRVGVSGGRLRYVELSQKDPFLLSSFVLEDDGRSWTMEHQVVLTGLWADAGAKEQRITNHGLALLTHVTTLIIGNTSLAVEMNTGKILQHSMIDEVDILGPTGFSFNGFLKPCMLPRRLGGLSAAVSGPLRGRRGLATRAAAPRRPPWAIIYDVTAVTSTDLRASFKLAEPPCASRIFVPSHLVGFGPRLDPNRDNDAVGLQFGDVGAVSGDGLLLLNFYDARGVAPIVGYEGTCPVRQLRGFDLDPDTMRFVCNPLSGQLSRLPDIDGAKKTLSCDPFGLLTHSERPHGPPDRYVVADLVEDDDGMERRGFTMRRFLSPKREWDKLVGLPSPLPVSNRRHYSRGHEVLAFAGRLWWVDVSWGAITADPFSDPPELRFVELPNSCLMEPLEGIRMLHMGRYRRMGVSQGRLHYAEVTQEEPYLLSSFALEDDGTWTLQHRVALTRLWPHLSNPCDEYKLRIGVVDPLNPNFMHLTVGNSVLSVDMVRQKAVACYVVDEDSSPCRSPSGFLKPCVLPPWLGSSQIPSAGTLSSNRTNAKSKTLSDLPKPSPRFAFLPRHRSPSAAAPGLLRRALSTAASHPRSSEMLLRRLGDLSAAISVHLRRCLSTSAASQRPPWAMVYIAAVVRSPDPRPSFQLAEPPCASHIFIPDHLVGLGPGHGTDPVGLFRIKVRAVSGDGLLLIDLHNGPTTAPIIGQRGTSQVRRLARGYNFHSDPDATRFVCNPLSGQLFRLPDIDGTKKTSYCNSLGLLTRSDNADTPPDRYAVAELVEDKEGAGRGFLMRRFLSPKGVWDKLVGLPSPVANRRHNDRDHEVVAFAGRLWWVDVTWGAVSADPFSDQPELRV
ncbi:hypothetical protein U9M48_044265 [Paspalum notatum var. saurae]|uniref:DUF1618 domain-containing protein n=1 Tax=Paspalum notatum var. saurae TaxID=547442 RepID=A0AAQ3UUQ2_PASNO